MAIQDHELEEMNRKLEGGMPISAIAAEYPQYGYWEIYWSVDDFSMQGKKRKITNRIDKAKGTASKEERDKLLEEIYDLVTEMYELTKKNGKKLLAISKIVEE